MIVNKINVDTKKRCQFIDITTAVKRIIVSEHFKEGLCTVFIPHTTAGVTVNEAADPDVATDILSYMEKAVPFEAGYSHGEGNSAAHIKTLLTGSSLTIPVSGERLLLGRWQGIYFCEYDGPRTRSVVITLS